MNDNIKILIGTILITSISILSSLFLFNMQTPTFWICAFILFTVVLNYLTNEVNRNKK